jgi:Rieske Fe-S protein
MEEQEDSTNKEEEEEDKQESSNSERKEGNKRKTITTAREELLSRQGTVVEDKKLAIYKDQKGKLHAYSAVCTHLGCIVTWNNSEKSFDCPCHGSRFSANTGNVINGPANSELEQKEVQ